MDILGRTDKMKRTILIVLISLIALASSVYALSIWPADGLIGGATGDLDDYAVATLSEGDAGFVFTISGEDVDAYWYVFDASGTDAESSPAVIRPDDYSSGGNWRLVGVINRFRSSHAYTNGETQTTVTEAHMLANRFLTDQGGSAETDLILTAVSYYIDMILKDTEGNGFEICPPSGEILYLEGLPTGMTADHCVDHTGSVGTWAVLSRAQIADGSWVYMLFTAAGSWVDGNDTGD